MKPSFDLAEEMNKQFQATKETGLGDVVALLGRASSYLEKAGRSSDEVSDFILKLAAKKPDTSEYDKLMGKVKELDKLLEKEHGNSGRSSLFEALLQEQERLLQTATQLKFPAKKEK